MDDQNYIGYVQNNGNDDITVASLLMRVAIFLEDGNWKDADSYCEKVLDRDPKNGDAYLGKLMAELHVRSIDELKELTVPFDNSPNYQKIVRFGTDALVELVQGIVKLINLRNEIDSYNKRYKEAVDAMNSAKTVLDYLNAADLFEALGNWENSERYTIECRQKAELGKANAAESAKRREAEAFEYAERVKDSKYVSELRTALKMLEEYKRKKKAKELIEYFEQRIKDIEAMELLRKKRKKNFLIGAAITVIIAILAIAVYFDSPASVYNYTSVDGGVMITSLKDKNAIELKIPSKIGGKPVVAIGDGAFKESFSLARVTLPSSIERIGDSAFERCTSLGVINIPEGVLTIGNSAFLKCYCLNKIEIPTSVVSIGDEAFFDCRSIAELEFSEGLKSIGDSAFWGCKNIKILDLPESLESIGGGAFMYCESLQTVTCPGSVKEIPERIFYECTNLTSIILCEGVTTIQSDAFAELPLLNKVDLPESLHTIGEFAFMNCSSIIEITIPSGVKSIAESAFNNCHILNTVNYSGTMEEWKKFGVLIDKPNMTICCSDGNITQ